MVLQERQQERLDQEVGRYIAKMKDNIHIVMDIETNGLRPMVDDILSICMEKVLIRPDKTIEVIDEYNRYYFCSVSYNPKATAVNHFYGDKEISEARQKTKFTGYPLYFNDDKADLLKFVGNCTNFIGHNHVRFDLGWFEDDLIVGNAFDTMSTNYWLDPIFNISGIGPKLSNAVKFYEIEIDETKLHASSYDVEMTRRIFEQMLQLSTIRLKKWRDTTEQRLKEVTF